MGALQKVDVNQQAEEYEGGNALFAAVHRNDLNCLRLLLAANANPNSYNNFGRPPLWDAVTFMWNCSIIKLLLEAGADPNARSGSLGKPLAAIMSNLCRTHYSYRDSTDFYNAKHCLSLLLKAGANPNIHYENINCNDTTIMLALNLDTDCVQLLLDAKVDPNVLDKNGLTPLHIAANKKIPEYVPLLLAAKANPNAIDKEGFTPLHLTAKQGHIINAQHLVKNGANIDALTHKGQTVIDLAAEAGHEDLANMLKQWAQG